MSLAALLNQTISVQNPTGTVGKHGEKALGSATQMAARVQRTSRTIVTPDREREPIHAVIYVAGSRTVEYGAKITYGTETYRVMSKAEGVDGAGDVQNIKLECQLWSYS